MKQNSTKSPSLQGLQVNASARQDWSHELFDLEGQDSEIRSNFYKALQASDESEFASPFQTVAQRFALIKALLHPCRRKDLPPARLSERLERLREAWGIHSTSHWKTAYLDPCKDELEQLLANLGNARRRAGQEPLEGEQQDDTERLRLEIKALMQEPDLVRKALLETKIARHHGISKRRLQEIASYLDCQQRSPQKKIYTLGEYMAKETTARRHHVPGYLPVGATVLLAAQAKVGKTKLIADLIHATLSGGEFLGERVATGKVLFVSSDQGETATQWMFRDRGTDRLATGDNLYLMPQLDLSNLAELEEQIEIIRPALVVIDSLTSVSLEGMSEKDPEFARQIYRLSSLIDRYNCCCVLIHHENKDQMARGLGKVSGSSRIPAAVWGIWQMCQTDPGNELDSKRYLKIKPRDGESATLMLEFNQQDDWVNSGIFTFAGELGDTAGEKQTQSRQVLDLLAERGKPLTALEISELTGINKRNIHSVLKRLTERQILSKRLDEPDPRNTTSKLYWVYHLPDEGSDIHPPSEGSGTLPPSLSGDIPLTFCNKKSKTLSSQESIDDRTRDRTRDRTPEKCDRILPASSTAIAHQNQTQQGLQECDRTCDRKGGERGSNDPAIAPAIAKKQECDRIPVQTSLPIPQEIRSPVGDWVNDVDPISHPYDGFPTKRRNSQQNRKSPEQT